MKMGLRRTDSLPQDRVHNNPSPGDGLKKRYTGFDATSKNIKNIQMTHLIDHIPIIGHKIYFTR